MLAQVLWKTQVALHGQSNNVYLPAFLVSAASVLVIYKHFMEDPNEPSGDPIKHFLALIVVQMLPLLFLEMKILSCPDPVAMLSRFGTKVLLMHSCFLGLRVAAWPLLEVGLGFCNLIGLGAACVALYWGFGFCFSDIPSHIDIFGLLLLAVSGALCTEMLNFHRIGTLLENTIFTASSYMEILSFMPAVWMVHQTSKKSDEKQVAEPTSAQTQATFFFAFLVPFYVMEDLISAYRVFSTGEPLASVGHVVHFLLVLDFSCFLLSHIFNPEKVHGGFLRWLQDQLFV